MTTVFGVLALALLTPSAAHGDALAATDRASSRDRSETAIEAPSRHHDATVARIVEPVSARRRLGSRKHRVRVRPQTDWSGQAQVLLVLNSAVRHGRQFVEVLLAGRPNGSTGWIPRDHVVLGRTPYWIEASVRRRLVTVHRNGRRVRRMRAVVGTADTPTPRGLGAVYERNRQPDPRGFLGPWVLSLTVHSRVLRSFGGGPGRVGIHGRSGASLRDPLGSTSSHGCIRVANRHIRWMARNIPAGTPVRVRR